MSKFANSVAECFDHQHEVNQRFLDCFKNLYVRMQKLEVEVEGLREKYDENLKRLENIMDLLRNESKSLNEKRVENQST